MPSLPKPASTHIVSVCTGVTQAPREASSPLVSAKQILLFIFLASLRMFLAQTKASNGSRPPTGEWGMLRSHIGSLSSQ